MDHIKFTSREQLLAPSHILTVSLKNNKHFQSLSNRFIWNFSCQIFQVPFCHIFVAKDVIFLVVKTVNCRWHSLDFTSNAVRARGGSRRASSIASYKGNIRRRVSASVLLSPQVLWAIVSLFSCAVVCLPGEWMYICFFVDCFFTSLLFLYT